MRFSIATTWPDNEKETGVSALARIVKNITAGGLNTRYIEAGTVGKPLLVLLHDGAFGATAELCWDRVIDALLDEFHIFAPEMLGWGGTDKVVFLDRSPYAGRIPHIAAFVETLGLQGATFVGASFGGSMALRAAVAAGNPWRIGRLMSISGTGGPYRLPEGIQALADFTPDLESCRKLTELVTGTTEGLEDHIRSRLEGSLIAGQWECMVAPRLKNPATERPANTDPFLEQLRSLDVPVVLVAGARDPLLERGWANEMAKCSNKISVIEVDAGHEPNINQPELVADLVREFAAV